MQRAVILLLVASGCMKPSEKYCAMHPEDTVNCGGNEDGGMACVDNAQCVARDPATPVCSEDSVCVQCTADDVAACTDGRVCTASRTCDDCTSHTECDSGVCQANGRCADASMVAYVAAGGSGTECTAIAPCGNLITAEDTERPVIKVKGSISSPAQVLFDARSTAIYAEPGAAVTRSTPGNIIEVMGATTELAIYGLRIHDATGAGNGHGVYVINVGDPKITLDRVLIDSNDGSGVRATDAGDITITRSIIAFNTGSTGLVLTGNKFSVTNTIIAQNGRSTLMTAPGGANLQPEEPSVFEFNTVADNITSGGAANYRGIFCSTGFAMANNIVAGNDTSNCNSTYTLFTPGDTASGTGNMTGDPSFKSMTMASAPTFYRINPSSPAKNLADMAATLMTDIDGEARPIDGRSDAGADEVVP